MAARSVLVETAGKQARCYEAAIFNRKDRQGPTGMSPSDRATMKRMSSAGPEEVAKRERETKCCSGFDFRAQTELREREMKRVER